LLAQPQANTVGWAKARSAYISADPWCRAPFPTRSLLHMRQLLSARVGNGEDAVAHSTFAGLHVSVRFPCKLQKKTGRAATTQRSLFPRNPPDENRKRVRLRARSVVNSEITGHNRTKTGHGCNPALRGSWSG